MEANAHIILICPAVTNRLTYVARYLGDRLGIPVLPVTESEQENPAGNVVHYGSNPGMKRLSVYAEGLLSETGIRPHAPEVIRIGEQVFIYPAPEGFHLPFDLFSSLFYLLSRYEEYLPFIPDPHGRFEADQSLAWRHGFLQQPVVDQWVNSFAELLRKHFPDLPIATPEFRCLSTIDIDTPWAFRHKGILRSIGILAKRLILFNFKEFEMAIRVMTGKEPDPFDTYDFIRNTNRKHGIGLTWFFLAGRSGGTDGNYALGSRAFRRLVNEVGKEGRVGIHFSCRSNQREDVRRKEYGRFTKYTGIRSDINRQHFLILSFPETYRQLNRMGIRRDYTMGYASANGFRAGTSNPFRFYDLGREQETPLVLFPFIVMDVTCRQYLQLSPEEAIDEIKMLASRVKDVNGTFTSLWHNESLSEWNGWEGWRRVYEEGTRDWGLGYRNW